MQHGAVDIITLERTTRFSLRMEMSRLTRDGTAEPVSRDQILRHARGQRNIIFPCSADHEQDWQPYPVDPYSAICDDQTYIPLPVTILCPLHKITQNTIEPKQAYATHSRPQDNK